MSEFYCELGHLISGLRCKKCGGLPVSSSEDEDFAYDRAVENGDIDENEGEENNDNE